VHMVQGWGGMGVFSELEKCREGEVDVVMMMMMMMVMMVMTVVAMGDEGHGTASQPCWLSVKNTRLTNNHRRIG